MGGPARAGAVVNASVPEAPFGAPSLEQLTGLVFELASQLHVERIRRIALELALDAAGLLTPEAIERGGESAAARATAARALDAAMTGMTRVMTEDADPRIPLRAQVAGGPAPLDRPGRSAP